MPVEFASVTVSFFIHATEDAQRLLSTVSDRLGLAEEELQQETVEGYHGNAIISAKAHVVGKRAQQIVTLLLRNLSQKAKEKIASELDKSIDEHDSLYLRLDRQSMENGLDISDEEPIRVKLKPKFRVGGRNSMKESYMEMIV